jgi:hypothetical protein
MRGLALHTLKVHLKVHGREMTKATGADMKVKAERGTATPLSFLLCSLLGRWFNPREQSGYYTYLLLHLCPKNFFTGFTSFS